MNDPIEGGDRCVVIGDRPNFEENIGAMLTVTKRCIGCGEWFFEDADRGIIAGIRIVLGFHLVAHVRASYEKPMMHASFPDKHLIPIKGDFSHETDDVPAPAVPVPELHE